MNRALAAGEAGMAAQQAVLDSISANLSNAEVTGFRATRPDFAALVAPQGGALGVQVVASQTLFTQGRLDESENPNDLAIDGDGFFRVALADGSFAYTRAGDFTPDVRGRLVLRSGATLDGVRLPRGTTSFDVAADGVVTAHVVGKSAQQPAGRIKLYDFADDAALRSGDDGLFFATASAGSPYTGAPGSGGLGHLKQRCLERANVSIVGSMMEVLAAQRAYEANAKTVQAADEMLRLANNLERS